MFQLMASRRDVECTERWIILNKLFPATLPAGVGDVHLHQTRHTFARIVQEETGSFDETREALDHESVATTRVYVSRIAVKADRHSRKVAERMKASRNSKLEEKG